jgi:hypothetical protein
MEVGTVSLLHCAAEGACTRDRCPGRRRTRALAGPAVAVDATQHKSKPVKRQFKLV